MTAADILGVREMLGHPFMQHAFVAGTAIAAAAGAIGYFVVLRRQVFTGDALSHVAFTGAVAALAVGVDLRIGLFTAVVLVALLLAVVGDRGQADDVAVGAVFAWVLGIGALFLSAYATGTHSHRGTAGVTVLFGSVFGFDAPGARLAAGTAAVVLVVLVLTVRPLLFSSLDPLVAAAAGVRVRAINTLFLVLVALTAAVATQAVGALLLLALLAAPAATARLLTVRPLGGIAAAAATAVVCTWSGLVVSYRIDTVPPSFAITAALTLVFVAATAARALAAAGARTEG